MRVPFFVYAPKYIIPRKSDQLCALYDFFTTAADLAGFTNKYQTDGISLVPEILNLESEQPQHEYLYWENGTFNAHAQSVRLNHWFGFRSHPDKPIALYDIINDVSCEHDVASKHPEIIKEIQHIFLTAHTDSEWYINPGESELKIQNKRKKAESENTLQIPVKANTIY
jgi:arylsulfatase A-like enzyme